jgi:hypothetical protein
MTKQFELFKGRAARDEGMERVLENTGAWKRRARLVYHSLDWDEPLTSEDINFAIIKRIGEPHKPHAWGALTRWAIDNGLIKKVGLGQMRNVRSHAHNTPTYKRLK